ncbi:hypothetical protein PVA44_02455 [Entomospira nematocerorum]|uniref:Uncharacterized protein n=1 Tax=Entomospira nematocerorum TaxID=2719987 RepID=A0A968GC33_9SPIO|nr:hypothetical protein [Entomospira nematocera]NIZ47105.1 hypothetical protein [Entomospira nematocera]WDI34350.1 hypothetical protein PVA44_02455 [Entomospira nematocera]
MLTIGISLMLIGRYLLDNIADNKEFSREHFYHQQAIFINSEEFLQLHKIAVYMHQSMESLHHEKFVHQWKNYFSTNINQEQFYYIKSSRSSLRVMAEVIINHLQEAYPDYTWKFFDTIRARNRYFSVLLNEPQSYLFILSTPKGEHSIMAIAKPSLETEDYIIDLYREETVSETFFENLLIIYNELIR